MSFVWLVLSSECGGCRGSGLEIQYVRRANRTDADALSCDTVIDVRPTPRSGSV